MLMKKRSLTPSRLENEGGFSKCISNKKVVVTIVMVKHRDTLPRAKGAT